MVRGNLLGLAFRVGLIVGLLGCVVAIGLGRWEGSGDRVRRLDRVKFVNFPVLNSSFGDAEPRFVDVETGTESRLEVPAGDALDQTAVSPWRDVRGSHQVAGRWSSRSGKDVDLTLHEFGLARYSFPDGKPLNRVPTEVTPTGRLCWLPGSQARVLFAAGDGHLYGFAFEGSREADASADGCDTRPHRLSWKVAPPGDGEGHFQIADPYCPEGAGFEGRLIVTLSFQVRDDEGFRFTAPRLWWVRLDAEGSSIEAAGPLTGVADRDPKAPRERNPTMVRTPSGESLLAFLERRSDRDPWSLVAAEVEPPSGDEMAPRIDRSRAKVVVEDCDPSNLAFSHDGRWLYYVPNGASSRVVRRVAVPRFRTAPGPLAVLGAGSRWPGVIRR